MQWKKNNRKSLVTLAVITLLAIAPAVWAADGGPMERGSWLDAASWVSGAWAQGLEWLASAAEAVQAGLDLEAEPEGSGATGSTEEILGMPEPFGLNGLSEEFPGMPDPVGSAQSCGSDGSAQGILGIPEPCG